MATGVLHVWGGPSDRRTASTWNDFIAEKPAGWQVTLVNPTDGEQKIAKQLEDAQYLVTMGGGRIPPKVLETAKQLKLIQATGVGTEHLPRKWALEKGIFIANIGSANTIAVAEFTVLLMLACQRKFLLVNQAIREGKFRGNFDVHDLHELYDKTIGIVGMGNIGRRVAKICYYGFGANIIYFDTVFVPFVLRAEFKTRPVSLDELLATSDIITMHVPLLESTRKMIGYNELCKMKPSAYIINTSRGGIIVKVIQDGLPPMF